MAERRLSYRWLLGFLVVWLVLFGIWRWYQAPREARARLAHMRHVLAVVTQYVREHQGAWPRSWEEIEKTQVPADAPPRQGAWPEVRAHVKVNFQVDPRRLVEAGVDQFQAISPRGPCAGDYREEVQRLLEAIREALAGEKATQKASKGEPSAAGTGSPKLPSSQPTSSQRSNLSGEESPVEKASPSPVLPRAKEYASEGPEKKLVSEKTPLVPKLPGLPEESPESPPAKPSQPLLPADKEKPIGKEKPKASGSKQPSRIILPGLD